MTAGRAPGEASEPRMEALRAELARLSTELGDAEHSLLETERERDRLRAELGAARTGATEPLATRIRGAARAALPPDTRRGALARRVRRGLAQRTPTGAPPPAAPGPDFQAQYRHWLSRHQPDRILLELMRMDSEGWDERPTVGLLMRLRDPQPRLLDETLGALRAQTYTAWELCVTGEAGPEVARVLRVAAEEDPRIRRLSSAPGGGGPLAAQPGGELVAMLGERDRLRPHALHRVVEVLRDRADVGVLYTDEDRLLPSGEPGNPVLKPGWSPELLLSGNYLGHLTVLRRDLVDGGDGGDEHDLVLRATERTAERGLAVLHLAEMLCSVDPPDPSPPSGGIATAAALARRGVEGSVVPGPLPGWHHVRRPVAGTPSVAIVVPTRDRVDLLRACIESVDTLSTHARRSILIVDNDSRDPETLSYLGSTPHRVIRDPGHFNYPRIMNRAIAEVDADHVVLLNNDVTVLTPGWLEAMLEHSQRPEVGAVGCRLLLPDGRTQHEGIAIGVGCPALNLDLTGCPPLGRVVREASAVTGACMMMRRALYAEMGGLDERLRVSYNDVDLCLRLGRAGFRVIYTPLAELRHHESSSRGSLNPLEDAVRFAARWGHHSRVRDPFLSPHLAWLAPLTMRLD
jgi:GT2 family glycosyltransferase